MYRVRIKDLVTNKETMVGPKGTAKQLENLNKALCNKYISSNRSGRTHNMVETVRA